MNGKCEAVRNLEKRLGGNAAETIQNLEEKVEELEAKIQEFEEEQKDNEALTERVEELESHLETLRAEKRELESGQSEKQELIAELLDYLDMNCTCERARVLLEKIQFLDRMDWNQARKSG